MEMITVRIPLKRIPVRVTDQARQKAMNIEIIVDTVATVIEFFKALTNWTERTIFRTSTWLTKRSIFIRGINTELNTNNEIKILYEIWLRFRISYPPTFLKRIAMLDPLLQPTLLNI